VAGPRGPSGAAAGVPGSVGAVLSVRGGAGPRGAVLVPLALSPGGGSGGGGSGSRVGTASSVAGPDAESTGVNDVQTTGPLGRDAGTGDS